MPTYVYKCSGCGNGFELRQGFDAATVNECPDCGQLAKRQISAVPVIFKGNGWYVNDYGPKNSAAMGDVRAESESKSEESKKGESSKSEESKKGESSKSEESKKPESKSNESGGSSKSSQPKEAATTTGI